MEAEQVILTLSDGKTIKFHKDYIARSTFLKNYTEQFQANEVSIKPPQNRPFQIGSLEKVRTYLEKYPKNGPKLPKKPFLSTTNFEDYLNKNDDVKTFFGELDNFYEVVELFNCATFLGVTDLLQLIGAKIAYHIMFERQSSEDHLREFSLVTKYPTFFSAEEEEKFRDGEFANPKDFEGVIDFYAELGEALP